MPYAKPKYPLLESVARAIFKAEQYQLTGHNPTRAWIDSGWTRCKSMAEAAIAAMQLEGK